MIVSEAIALLKHNELKQLSVKDDNDAVLGFLNFGILEIHKRFALWEPEAIITQADGVSLYTLDGNDVNVSIDLSDHDLLMIQNVYDEDNIPYVINNEKDPDSISTPKFHQIKVETIVPDYVMSVIYRASPKFLTTIDDTIPLPSQFFEALFLYVGYKGQTSVKAGIKDENNTHYVRFEASCDRIDTKGLKPQKDLTSTKFVNTVFP